MHMIMPKHTKITLGGLSGTGKGTVAALLAKRLGFSCHSAGDFFREIARERGYDSVLALQEMIHKEGEEDTSVDEMVDARTRMFGASHDRFIVEGRLCAHMIPQAFNILLTCADELRFARIASREGIQLSVARAETEARERLYSNAYKKFYNIESYADPKHYDLVIDTSAILPDEIVERIIKALT
ncbi:MAG: hypothetical protein RL150_221 [Candidatus Parcubacteria bacterium]